MNTKPQRCPVYKKCGGCQLDTDYPSQLAFKQNRVEKLLHSFGKAAPIIGMDKPCHYRNKVQAAFYTNRSGKIISGVYQSGTHHVVGIDSCMIEDETADRIIVGVRKLMPSFKMTTYNEDTGKGFLRHVLVKRGFATNEVMLVLVTGSAIFPSKNHFVKEIVKQFPQITTVVQNVNPYRTNLVLGDKQTVLYGSGTIEDILCGCRFRISPKSFYQINPVQTEVLYQTAVDFAALTGKETVLDAYCGIGTIGITASEKAKQIVGVELNRDAVRDAIANAKLNGLKNCWFTAGDAGEYMERMVQDGHRPDVVFLDPPRAGSDERFLRSLTTAAPDRVVYVSCDPETLARDLRVLTGGGYRVRRIQPVDMFPWTEHVECVVKLDRR